MNSQVFFSKSNQENVSSESDPSKNLYDIFISNNSEDNYMTDDDDILSTDYGLSDFS